MSAGSAYARRRSTTPPARRSAATPPKPPHRVKATRSNLNVDWFSIFHATSPCDWTGLHESNIDHPSLGIPGRCVRRHNAHPQWPCIAPGAVSPQCQWIRGWGDPSSSRRGWERALIWALKVKAVVRGLRSAHTMLPVLIHRHAVHTPTPPRTPRGPTTRRASAEPPASNVDVEED